MTIQISYKNGEVLVKGDTELLAKLPGNFDVNSVELHKDTRINAQQVGIAFSYADASAGNIEKIGYYAAIKQAFERQYALGQIERDKPKESHEPAITTASIKGL